MENHTFQWNANFKMGKMSCKPFSAVSTMHGRTQGVWLLCNWFRSYGGHFKPREKHTKVACSKSERTVIPVGGKASFLDNKELDANERPRANPGARAWVVLRQP